MRDPFKNYWFASFSIYEGTKVKTAGHHLFQTDALTNPKDAYREIMDYFVKEHRVNESDIVLSSFNRL